ncbi:MAG: hypothetical protein KAU17_14625 [Spirochaetales bacterium]|nr:hypothetical protein [Spirochaetales bacterium]
MDRKLFGVAGNPILMSRSPGLFRLFFEEDHRDDLYLRLAADTPFEAVELFHRLQLSGMNVTAPFKGGILPLLDEVTTDARVIGGVNTVFKAGETLKGDNTDFSGVLETLRQNKIDIKGKRVIILGAGGAAGAAAYAARKLSDKITIINRTLSKARKLAKNLGCETAPLEDLEKLLPGADVLISTLSRGVDPIDEKWLHPELVVFDANYPDSRLLKKSRAAGCRVLSGEEWLFHQGTEGYLRCFPPQVRRPVAGKHEYRASEFRAQGMKVFPRRIALTGFMGAGKTAIGRLVAEKLRFRFIDLDEEIEARVGLSIPEIFARRGEGYFRERERKLLDDVLREDGIVISCGGGIILDRENRELLKKQATVVWLVVSREESLKRIRKGSRPLLTGQDLRKRANEIMEERFFLYAETSDMVLLNEGKEELSAAERIYAEVSKVF